MANSFFTKYTSKRKHLSEGQKQAERTLYILGSIACLFLLFLLLWTSLTGKTIAFPECAFHKLTGYYCPGCGGTRALVALMQGSIIDSLIYHPLIIYTLVFGGWFMLSQTVERLSKGCICIGMPVRNIYFYIALGIALFHAIFLNYYLLFENIDFLSQI